VTGEGLLSQVERICLALPETSSKVSHGAPSFMVAGKMFAYFSDDHHSDGRTAVLVKTSGLEEQEMLIEAEPDLYYRPPYIGHKGWIGLRLDRGDPDWDHVSDRIAYSWELTAPRRLLEMGGR
jgi:phosphoribosylglycinamide formyltransferase-1/phosphoribosylamine--glycine ligase/phosphoribosylglycinamide formyltransferase/phosphoribosylformylglycinamidine cyclo-ligase